MHRLPANKLRAEDRGRKHAPVRPGLCGGGGLGRLRGAWVLLIFLFLGSLAWARPCPAGEPDDEVIATLNGRPITLSEVKRTVAFQIYRLRGNIYHLLKRETERIVDERLLAAEAERRGLTVEELLEKEVDDKVPPLDEAEVDRYLEEHPSDAGAGPERRDRIRTYLSERARIRRKLDFMAALRKSARFEFLLEPPERPRTRVEIRGQPWRGNPGAPVTLVHFAGFTCRFCPQSARMIRRIMEAYPGKIKWVHRNFFRPGDERALEAARMGEFAQARGKFWAFHDKLFALGSGFEPGDLKKIARELGLDLAQYERLGKDGRFLRRVKEDIDAARRIGLTAMPVIFVNGLYFSSTFGYERLRELVQRELDRIEPKKGAAGKSPGPGSSTGSKGGDEEGS